MFVFRRIYKNITLRKVQRKTLQLDIVYQVSDFEAGEDGLFELPQEVRNLE